MENQTNHPLYNTYDQMKKRCRLKTNISYKYYGRRGIKVCKIWLRPKTGFQNFLKSMGDKPTPKHTLDRINNNGNYTPKNCKWSTVTEQNNNQRKHKPKFHKLNEKSLSEIRYYLSIPSMSIMQIAKSYNVCFQMINNIKLNKSHSNKI